MKRARGFWIFVALWLQLASAWGGGGWDSPTISVARGLVPWLDGFSERMATWRRASPAKLVLGAYQEMVQVQELPGTFLLVSSQKSKMNHALSRASAFAEGLYGHRRGTLIPVAQLQDRLIRHPLGHDLTRADLLAFLRAVETACPSRPEYCLSREERDLFGRFILPLINGNSADFVLITTGFYAGNMHFDIIHHEFLHARYFLDASYRQAVDGFWENHLSEEERRVIREALSASYDAENEFLIRNEFQAYILMEGSGEFHLKWLVPRIRLRLAEYLGSRGLAVPVVQRCEQALLGGWADLSRYPY